MARNKLAGSKKGTSRTARFYQSHPLARKKKKSYDSKYQKGTVKYRQALNAWNEKFGKKGDGKDGSHQPDGSIKAESQKSNRARKKGKKNTSKLKSLLRKRKK